MKNNIKFYNLNIKHKEYLIPDNLSAAEHWLDVKKRAPVFYGSVTAEDILSGTRPDEVRTQAYNELIDFLTIHDQFSNTEAMPVFVTVDGSYVWVYEPIGPIQSEPPISFTRNGQNKFDVPKSYGVRFLVPKTHVSEVPLVLASIKSNQAFSRGTFRAINAKDLDEQGFRDYSGNVAALHSLVASWPDDFVIDPLSALSSMELETLVAKLFEELGCFVPAYRGGTLPMVDLFLYLPEQGIVDLEIRENVSRISIQIKLTITTKKDWKKLEDWTKKSDGNILLTLQKLIDIPNASSFPKGSLLTRDWLSAALAKCPKTNDWLQRSVKWLPLHCRSNL